MRVALLSNSMASVRDNLSMDSQVGRRCWIMFRVAVSVGLLWLLLRKIAIGDVLSLMSQSVQHWPFLILAAMTPILGVIIAGYRWKVLLAAQDIHMPVVALGKAILVGIFYNQLLPSTIGGDIARSWWVSKLDDSCQSRLSPTDMNLLNLTVVGVDRFLGMLSICGIALLAAVIHPSVINQFPVIWLFLFVVASLAVLAIFTPFTWYPEIKRFHSIKLYEKLCNKVRLILHALYVYRRHRSRLVKAFVLAMALQIVVIIEYRLLAAAFEVDVSIWGFALVVPIVNLISFIPITINGIGLRENALIVVGKAVDLPAEGAIALAWAFVAIMLMTACVGGLLQLYGRRTTMS